jgi:integrase/recombinase XerD
MIKKDMTFSEAFNFFIREKEAKYLSAETIKTYKIHILKFIEILDCSDVLCSKMDKEDYIFFLTMLQTEDVKSVTVASYCRSIKAFLYYLIDNELIKPFKVTIPKADTSTKNIYTDEELSRLLQKRENLTFGQYQTYIFINFALATGLRLGSILNIQLCDYDSKQLTVNVKKTKRRVGLVKYINKQLADMLDKYIALFQLKGEDYLFCVEDGAIMSVRNMQQNVARYNNIICEVDKTSIHLFRHTFAVKYIRSGGNVLDLQKLLQHRDLNTTMNYLKDLGLDTKNAVNVFNPQTEFNVKKSTSRKRKM